MDRPVPEIMTLEEAAMFLRLSRSTLYQRPDIPRHRLPGSRQIRFLRSELLAWLKQGRLGSLNKTAMEKPLATHAPTPEDTSIVVDMSAQPVYHRNARYR